MEVIKPFQNFYSMFQKMKSNDEQYPLIMSRLNQLQQLVAFVQPKGPDQLPADVKNALGKLHTTMKSAEGFVKSYQGRHVVTQAYKSSDYKLEFENLNKNLTDAFVALSGALYVHQEKKLNEQEMKQAKQEMKMEKQGDNLVEQEKKMEAQKDRLAEQEKKIERQEEKLAEQEKKLEEQKKKLEEQEKKLEEQGEKLAKLEHESQNKGCVLL